MTNNYKLVSEKIRELVPRLQELSFGCEVIRNGNKYIYLKPSTTEIAESMECLGNDTHLVLSTDKTQEYVILAIDEVIGHPIMIEDVLEALEIKSGYLISFYRKFPLKPNQVYIKAFKHSREFLQYEVWELGQPLHQQSEEVILFLKKILCDE